MGKRITVNLTDEAYEILQEVPSRLRGFVISRALTEAKKAGLIDIILGKNEKPFSSKEVTQKDNETFNNNINNSDDEAILEL